MGGTSGGNFGGGNILQLLCAINQAAPNLVTLLDNKDEILQLAKDTYAVSQAEQEKSNQVIADTVTHQATLDGLKKQISDFNTAKNKLASDQTALGISQAEVTTQQAGFAERETKVAAAENAYKADLAMLTAAQAQLITDRQKLVDDQTSFTQEKAEFETYAANVKAKAAQIQGLTAGFIPPS